jgi:outer membrane protein OmpA-like peptidoglycan-associated protein
MHHFRPTHLLKQLLFVLVLAVAAAACGGDGEPDQVARGTARVGTTPPTTASGSTDAPETTEASNSTEAPTATTAADEVPSDQTTVPDNNGGEDGEDPEAPLFSGNPGEIIRVSGAEGIDGSGDVQGSIDSEGEQDVYTFNVTAGQSILLEQLGCDITGSSSIRVALSTPSRNFSGSFSERQECLERDRYDVRESGEATLTVGGANDLRLGTYSFRIVDVTTTPIELTGGAVVAPDSPPGAGNLEREGFTDIYHFNAVEDEAFVIEQLGGCEFTGDDALRIDIEGAGMNRTETLREGDCRDAARFEPEESGLVVITVGHNSHNTTGVYSFQLNALGVEGELADLPIGDSTNPEATEIISGEISRPGEEDVYTIPVREDQQLLVQQTGNCAITNGSHFRMDVDGPAPNLVFRMEDVEEGDCVDNDFIQAEADGEITLTVRDQDSEATGTYNFRLLWVPIDPVVPLLSGDVVAPGQPTEGAGRLVLGQRDQFSFDALDDQVFVIEGLGGCDFGDVSQIFIEIEGAGERTRVLTRDASAGDCLKTTEFEAERAGEVIITVGDDKNLAVGTYSFRLRLMVDNAEQAQVILDELGAEETDEGTVITLEETLLFDFGSAELREESLAALGRAADALSVVADGEMLIVGHTDAVGDEATNLTLSQARAQAVADALADGGVDAGLLKPEGRGETQPVADNENADGSDNPEGRALNRRVEIIFTTS